MWFFNRYEHKELLEQYLKSQWGPTLPTPYLNSEPFYQEILKEAAPYIAGASALDVGSALGRLVFEYEKLGAKRAVGIDTSKQFIRYCATRKTPGTEFVVGDILKSPFPPHSFSFISCVNVIDRVSNPKLLVEKLHDLLVVNGVLLLVDPFDWELSSTPQKFRVSHMTELVTQQWQVLKERGDLSYTTPIGAGERTYRCELVLLQKRTV
jgi:SAM-dependent methyltransferase